MTNASIDHQHTPWSDPGSCRERLRELPDTPAALADVLEGG